MINRIWSELRGWSKLELQFEGRVDGWCRVCNENRSLREKTAVRLKFMILKLVHFVILVFVSWNERSNDFQVVWWICCDFRMWLLAYHNCSRHYYSHHCIHHDYRNHRGRILNIKFHIFFLNKPFAKNNSTSIKSLIVFNRFHTNWMLVQRTFNLKLTHFLIEQNIIITYYFEFDFLIATHKLCVHFW